MKLSDMKMVLMVMMMIMMMNQVGGKTISRTNFGVILKEMGELHSSYSFWYHHFVVELPKLNDIVPALCLKHVNKPRPLSGKCQTYASGPENKIGNLLVNMNKRLIDEFKQVAVTARRHLPKLPPIRKMNRNKRSAPLSFIGDLSSTIFGTATQDDLRKVADKVNALISRGVDIGKTLVQHEKNFESYMENSNHRYDELREIVIDNHNAVMEAHKADMLRLDQVRAYAQANTEAIRRLNATLSLAMHVREVSLDIRAMSRGVFPESLVSYKQIKQAARGIGNIVKKQFPDYTLLHPEPEYFYEHGSFSGYSTEKSGVWITLKFPVGLAATATKLYRINTYPVPVTNDSSHATHIDGLPEYVVIANMPDGKLQYAEMTEGQVRECKGNGKFFCEFVLKFVSVSKDSCISALIKDDADKIHGACEFSFIRDQIKPDIVPLSDATMLFYNIDQVALSCGQKEEYNVTGCAFCMFHIPCGCRMKYGSVTVNLVANQACAKVEEMVSRKHLVNLAVLKAFETDIQEGLKASTFFSEHQHINIPKIEFYDHHFKEFISSDNQTRYNLKKIAERARNNEKIFETLSDPLLMGSIDLPSDLFTREFILNLVSIALIIVVIVVLIYFRRRYVAMQNDMAEMKRQLALLLPAHLIVGKADAVVTVLPENKGQAQLFKTTTKQNIIEQVVTEDSTFHTYHEQYISPVLLYAMAVICFIVAFYILYRCCKKSLNRTKVYLLITDVNFAEYIEVLTIHVEKELLDFQQPKDGIGLKVSFCFLPRLRIDWCGSKIVDKRPPNESLSILPSSVSINPVKAFNLYRYLKKTETVRVKFSIYFQDKGSWENKCSYNGKTLKDAWTNTEMGRVEGNIKFGSGRAVYREETEILGSKRTPKTIKPETCKQCKYERSANRSMFFSANSSHASEMSYFPLMPRYQDTSELCFSDESTFCTTKF